MCRVQFSFSSIVTSTNMVYVTHFMWTFPKSSAFKGPVKEPLCSSMASHLGRGHTRAKEAS